MKFFREEISSPNSRLLLYTAEEPTAPPSDQRIMVSSSSLPSQRIIGFSHQSLTIPPEDPHYGRNGEYRNCLHYGKNSADFARCREGKSDWFGERTRVNKGKGVLQRLTWNPKFREMLEAIDNFLGNLP